MSDAAATGSLPVRAELVRKALHLSSAVLPIAWGLGFVTTETVRISLIIACRNKKHCR